MAVGPYLTVAAIKTGIIEKDSEILSDNIDFGDLRQNMKDQLNAIMVESMTDGLEDNPFGVLTVGFGGLMVDRMVDIFVTPAQLARMMAGESATLNEEGDDGDIMKEDLFKDARYEYDSIDKFSIWVPNDDGDEIRFVIRRKGIKWKLVNISFAHLLDIGDSKTDIAKNPRDLSGTDEDIQNEADRIKQEELDYIKNELRLYAFEAMPDHWALGDYVSFKIKNEGEKTVYDIDVTVYFKDSEGKIIHEESINQKFYDPLKPGYIDNVIEEVGVPSEWAVGNDEIEITGISFDEKSSSSIF